MKRITGSQGYSGPSHTLTLSPDSGATFPWEGNSGGTNSGNGNHLTQVPIVSWTARGGMPVNFNLAHNSQSSHNSELGYKWTHSFDIYLVSVGGVIFGPGGGSWSGLAVHWGDDQSYIFTLTGGVYVPPTGIHDSLVANIDGSYTLTRTDQTQFHFMSNYYCDTISDENSNTITIGYNVGNFVVSITDPTSRAIALSYDGSNRISTITDPLSRVWTCHYTSGNLTSVDLPVINSTTYSWGMSYGTTHDITTLTTPGGRSSTATYDTSDDSLSTSTDGSGNETDFWYDTGATTVTDPNGNTSVDGYSSGRLSYRTDAESQTEYYYYDGDNNRTQLTTKRGYSYYFTFNAAGCILTSENPYSNVVTNTFNGNNKLLTKTAPTGEYVTYTRDGSDNVTAVVVKDNLGVTQASSSYTIGAHGLVSDYYDPNTRHTQYGYSSNGDLTSVITPLGKETDFTSDGLGVRLTRVDALTRTTTYSPDAWERITLTTYPDTSTHTVTFDPDNLSTQFVDGSGTTNRTYDVSGRILTEALGATTVASYSYDGTGQLGLLSTLTDVNSRVLTYSYTARNELSEVSETAGNTFYTHDEDGNTTAVTNPNTTTVARVFDHADRLTAVTNKNSGGTTLSSFSYTLDDDGRRDYVVESDGSTVSLGYDWGSRLTGETRTGTNAYAITYTVDAAGNRTSQTKGTATTAFTLNNDDALTATTSSTGGFVNSYSYNDNGEQTGRTLSGTAYTLAYDYDGQMISSTVGGVTTSFAYDASGRRVSRTAGGTTTKFYFDGGRILDEKQGSTTTAVYTYGEGLIRKDSEVPLFDGQGSERTVTNGSQTVVGTLNLDGFGNQVGSTGSSSDPYMFAATAGYRNGGDAGLTHVGARYYDAQVGLFTTRDTELTQKAYLYCEHDPVNNLDPTGHDDSGRKRERVQLWFQVGGGVIGAGVGGRLGGNWGAAAGGGIGIVTANELYYLLTDFMDKDGGHPWSSLIPFHDHGLDQLVKSLDVEEWKIPQLW